MVILQSHITGYGSTLYIGIAMVFVFSPYIWKFTSCFQFQVNLTFNDFTVQNLSKVICVPNISLNYHFLDFVHGVLFLLLVVELTQLNNHSTTTYETWYLHRFW